MGSRGAPVGLTQLRWSGLAVASRLVWSVTRSPRWSFRHGRALEHLGRPRAALGAYERALRSPAARAEWHLARARLLEEGQEWSEAAACYRTAVEQLPSRPTLRLDLARALERAEQRSAAREELHALLALQDQLSEGDLFDLGAQFERCGDLLGAREAYTRIDTTRSGARSTKLAVRLARIHRRLGEVEPAAALVDDALSAAPGHHGLLREHAELASAARDWDEAARRWAAIIAASPEPPSVLALTKLSLAQRSRGDLDAAASTVLRGRELYPDDLRVAIEDARISMAMYSRVAEDAKHGWKERLVRLERQLGAQEDAVLGVPPHARVLGNLRLALRDWSSAVATWRAIEATHAGLRGEACIKQAKAHRSAGKEAFARAALPSDDPARLDHSRAEEHFVLARTALERVAGTPSSLEHVRAEQLRLAVQYGRWSASHAASIGQLHLAAGDVDTARGIITGALGLRGYTPEETAAVVPIVERLGGLATAGDPTRPRSLDASRGAAATGRGHAPQTVLVSGFLYSGSGAAYDYLRQYPSTAEPFGSHELWVLKKLNNFGLLLDPENRDVTRFPEVAVASILTNIFGFGQMGYPISVYFQGTDVPMAELTDMVVPFVDELARLAEVAARADEPVGLGGVEDALRGLFTALVTRFTPATDIALLNNVVPAFRLVEHLDLFPGARAVVVLRDPRDQYVSQRLESPYSRHSESFVTMMQSRYRSFGELMTSELRDRVLPVSFESFVDDDAVRRRVARWAGVDAAGLVDGDEVSFDPARSRRNIGIHAAYEHQAEVAFVERHLSEPFAALFAESEAWDDASASVPGGAVEGGRRAAP